MYPVPIPNGTLCLIFGLRGTDECLNGKSVVVEFESYILMNSDTDEHDICYLYTPQLTPACNRILGRNLMPLNDPTAEKINEVEEMTWKCD